MGELSGRTFLVTGANTGIGFATAHALVRRGARVHLACRSVDKGQAAVARLIEDSGNPDVAFLRLDLADLSSVRAAAQEFLAGGEPLHVLINNAGLAGERGVTKDGFELIFGVNHLGHFAFTTALLDRLISSQARIVNVASEAHFQARGIDFAALRRRTKTITGMPEYAASKLCNVLFAQELARRLVDTGVTSYSLHPGVVASDIWRRVPWPVRPLITSRMLSVDEGAKTSLSCATSPDVAQESGLYYDRCKVREPSSVATQELGERLWQQSEAWVGA